MKRILLAPDSFKGTLSAREVCEIERAAIRAVLPDAIVTALPLSDGGEGLSEACLSIFGGERATAAVTGPDGGTVQAEYALLPDGTAAMEMAAAAGLPLLNGRLEPLRATTFGVGELLLDAQRRGAKRVLLGLGGSASNDCGLGMAAALGWRFRKADGAPAEPRAENLGVIARMEAPEKPFSLPLTAACDVDNPLLGAQGAVWTFGAQKGVTAALAPQMEEGMARFAGVLRKTFPNFDPDTPGAGAAGGMGAAVLSFLRGTLRPGIELLLDAAHFDELAARSDLIITGEGRMDAQSLHGKAPCGVALRALHAKKPCLAVCGTLGAGAEEMKRAGVTAMYAASDGTKAMDALRATCREELYRATVRALTEQANRQKAAEP